jgi:dTMP kinase
MRGHFITFEGGEGAGKSTQLRRLADYLRARGLGVTVTREPGGTPAAERIRAMLLAGDFRELGPEAEAVLFFAARINHLDEVIRPALARGDWVLCDRFVDSTRAYQGGEDGVDPKMIETLERIAVGNTMPELTIILDVPVEMGLKRAIARLAPGESPDRFEHADRQRLGWRRQAFLAIAEREPQRCVLVDAARSEDDVAAAIRSLVETRLLSKAA